MADSLLNNIEDVFFEVKDEMEYETLGDYKDGVIQVYSGLDKIERTAVAIHELVEMTLLHLQGVTDKMITDWDTEDTNGKFDCDMYTKDGRYAKAHYYAESIEKMIIETAGKEWQEYSDKSDDMKIKWKGGEEK